MLAEYAAALRKLKDSAAAEGRRRRRRAAARSAWCRKRFVADTPWAQLQHLPRYLKAIALRLDKLRADPARDARAWPSCGRSSSATGAAWPSARARRDARLDEFRWLLEELRVSLFAQELRTPQPVSVKRLDKVWAQAFA